MEPHKTVLTAIVLALGLGIADLPAMAAQRRSGRRPYGERRAGDRPRRAAAQQYSISVAWRRRGRAW